MVGAGLFGFFINPPIALYYMQGLNTTPVHGHTALFGVYGMLGHRTDALLSARAVRAARMEGRYHPLRLLDHKHRADAHGAPESAADRLRCRPGPRSKYGYWYARSADFLYSPTLEVLKWLRAPGDTVFAIGILTLVLFIFGLATGHSLKGKDPKPREPSRKTPERVS